MSQGETLVVAYVLITTATGKEDYVVNQIRDLPELTEAHQLFGQYDVIARLETDDYDKLCDVVLQKVRSVSGVTGSRTLICARFNREQ
ncbi:MAG: Lrp/AsnC ligand binding domain-containing protein [Methanobacteriota archaeon]|nr:MAG: Lrp/AsnC ligand binding domain-containing protein [Euryarchaeota archaeon]